MKIMSLTQILALKRSKQQYNPSSPENVEEQIIPEHLKFGGNILHHWLLRNFSAII
jgi:hypothetical protein